MDSIKQSQLVFATAFRIIFYGFFTWLFLFKSWGNELVDIIDKFVWLFMIAIEPARAAFRRLREEEELMERTYEAIDKNLGASGSKSFRKDNQK
jgi:hypothetical protein